MLQLQAWHELFCWSQCKMNRTGHWEKIYADKAADQVGWYTPRLETSLEWITALGLNPDDPIIDVGGGASTLVDDLLESGHTSLTVLDISGNALEQARQRLREKSESVNWLQGDITEIELPQNHYRLWHDRAVFHFLTEQSLQQSYRYRMLGALRPGGYVVMGCFAPDAPPTCSGLQVQRYTAEALSKTLGGAFALKRRNNEIHTTPSGVKQAYIYCLFQRIA